VLLGRKEECLQLDRLMAQAHQGTSGALVLRGEAGIGKSRLLRYAIDQADIEQVTVLSARGMESESELPFASLAELLHPILDRLTEIPEPQSIALAGALAVGPPTAPDPFSVYAATLSLIASAAERKPVLAVVDDAHWLDASSRDALLFATRRLSADRTVVLFGARSGEAAVFEAHGVPELVLGGIDHDACHALLVQAGAASVARSVTDQIVQATGGNPLAILEVTRLLTPAQLAGEEPLSEPLPAGPGVQRLFERRAAVLSIDTQKALLVAAASQTGSITEIQEACSRLGVSLSAFEPAEADGLVSIYGLRIEFTHPLVRAAVYQHASGPDRRAAHRALADALAGERSLIQRAWHLAAAAFGADEQVAAALEEAALEARGRSGHAAASRAFERAARLAPDREQLARRLLEAGADAHVAGDAKRAIVLLDEAIAQASDVHLRADIEHFRARVEMWTRSPAAARKMLLETADRIESVDPGKAALILVDAATTCHQEGDPQEGVLRPALRLARRAYELGTRTGGIAKAAASGLLGKTLIVLGQRAEGYPLLLKCQAAIEETDSLWLALQLIQCEVVFLWLEEYDRARSSLERVIAKARAESAPGALPYPLCHLSEVDFRTGRWAAAYAGSSEAVQLATEMGQTAALLYGLVCIAWVEAGQGRETECRAHVSEALTLFGPLGVSIAAYAACVMGLLELGLGRPKEAIQQLEALANVLKAEQVGEPALFQTTPDLIEAYIYAGRRADAEVALASFQEQANKTGRTWAKATAARCRGMLAVDNFEAAFEEALRWHARTPTPFDRARTALCYGERLRRAKHRAKAREHLKSALTIFEQLGAMPWVERARNELRATGETVARPNPSSSERLTLQELKVALKVAEGATNREAAAALFLSVKTVEVHLSHIYSKLGVRSRTELTRRLAREGAPAVSPVVS
jgi:DNA-binding CsgD family transcriptional regulator